MIFYVSLISLQLQRIGSPYQKTKIKIAPEQVIVGNILNHF